MTQLQEQYRAREALVEALRRDLVGPESVDELLDDPPVTSYAAGILCPQHAGNVDAELQYDADARCFVERRGHEIWSDDEELLSYQLLYRHAKNFAVGHGCAADWDDATDVSHVNLIRTAFIPDYALRLADSNSSISGRVLNM